MVNDVCIGIKNNESGLSCTSEQMEGIVCLKKKKKIKRIAVKLLKSVGCNEKVIMRNNPTFLLSDLSVFLFTSGKPYCILAQE